MPCIPRGQIPGLAYHALNRGNGPATVVHKDADYRAFCDLLSVAKKKFSVALLGFSVMPNHVHLGLHPEAPSALSAWWLSRHVRRYPRHYPRGGHVWQGRYKRFPIQQDEHLLTVLRYVLFTRSARASSTALATGLGPACPPVSFGSLASGTSRRWTLRWLATPLTDEELTRGRTCVNRQAPFGLPEWIVRMASPLGLASSLRPRGRPRHSSSEK